MVIVSKCSLVASNQNLPPESCSFQSDSDRHALSSKELSDSGCSISNSLPWIMLFLSTWRMIMTNSNAMNVDIKFIQLMCGVTKMATTIRLCLTLFLFQGLTNGLGQTPDHPEPSESSTAHVCWSAWQHHPVIRLRRMTNLNYRPHTFSRIPQTLKSILLVTTWRKQTLHTNIVSINIYIIYI